MAPVDVVIATRDRRDRLLATLKEQVASGPSEVFVVDNNSGDGSPAAVSAAFPRVRVIRLPENLGAAARNAGVAASTTAYVAFSDDDSWWAPGALSKAAAVLDAHPDVGLLAARVLVGASSRLDPVCAQMAASPLVPRRQPGPDVLGFLACGAVVRRDAFLHVGGFSIRFGIGGEEDLLAIDLRRHGWRVVYCEDVVARHMPLASRPSADGRPWRDPGPRRRRQTRNALWTTWLRRPLASCVVETSRIMRGGPDRWLRQGIVDAAADWRWVLTHRAPVSQDLDADLRRLSR